MSQRWEELMQEAFNSCNKCGIEIRDKYAYASGYLASRVEFLETENKKLRDELNRKCASCPTLWKQEALA